MSGGEMGLLNIGLRGFLWRLAKATAWVAGGLALLTLLPEDLATFLALFSRFSTWPVVILLVAILIFALLKPQAFGLTVMAIFVLAGAQAGLMWGQAAYVESLERRQFLPPSQDHRIVAARWSSSECDVLCMEVLAKSSLSGFAAQTGNEWTVFVVRRGPSCAEPDTRESYLAFLQAGFVDTCAVRTSLPAEPNPLRIEHYSRRGWSRAAAIYVPGAFEGDVYELREQVDGKDRLLARWIDGRIRPLSYWFGLVGLSEWKVGAPFEWHEFYAAALHAPLVGGRYPGGARLEDVFDRLASVPADAAMQRQILDTFRILEEGGREDQHDAIVRWATRSLYSGESSRILAGFKLLAPSIDIDFQAMKPRVIKLFDHGDPRVVNAALSMAFRFPVEERAALAPKFAALAKSPVLAAADSPVLGPLLGHFRAVGAFPERERARAKALLTGNDTLSGPQRVALLGIVAHGGSAMREQASETLLGLKDRAFFDLVVAMKDNPWEDVSGQKRDAWTGREKIELAERASRVPPGQLEQYVSVLRSQRALEGHDAEVAVAIEKRIEEAKAAIPADPKRVDVFERLLRSVQR